MAAVESSPVVLGSVVQRDQRRRLWGMPRVVEHAGVYSNGSRWFWLRSEIAKHAFEALLVGIGVLPSCLGLGRRRVAAADQLQCRRPDGNRPTIDAGT
jgi:hypothetical protein